MVTPRKPESEKKKAGRKSLYKPEFNDQVYKLCLLCATDEEIADFFNVSVSTINKWKLYYPEFSKSIKKGKVIADAEVAESLYKRATGYEYKEVKSVPAVERNNKDGEDKKVTDNKKLIVKEVNIKHIPPDPTSMFYWLKNRRPKEWRDKREVDVTTNGESLNAPVFNVRFDDEGGD